MRNNNSKQSNKRKQSFTFIKPLTLLVSLALGYSSNVFSAPNVDFAPIPLHLKDGKEVTPGKVSQNGKPNVIFIIDNSQRMSSLGVVKSLQDSLKELLGALDPKTGVIDPKTGAIDPKTKEPYKKIDPKTGEKTPYLNPKTGKEYDFYNTINFNIMTTSSNGGSIRDELLRQINADRTQWKFAYKYNGNAKPTPERDSVTSLVDDILGTSFDASSNGMLNTYMGAITALRYARGSTTEDPIGPRSNSNICSKDYAILLSNGLSTTKDSMTEIPMQIKDGKVYATSGADLATARMPTDGSTTIAEKLKIYKMGTVNPTTCYARGRRGCTQWGMRAEVSTGNPDYVSISQDWLKTYYNNNNNNGIVTDSNGTWTTNSKWMISQNETAHHAFRIFAKYAQEKHNIETFAITYGDDFQEGYNNASVSNSILKKYYDDYMEKTATQEEKDEEAKNPLFTGPNKDRLEVKSNQTGKLARIFREIFSSISTPASSTNTVKQSYSAINPALMQSNAAGLSVEDVAVIHLDLANGQSEIQFYKVYNNTMVDSSSYRTADMSNRIVLVKTGDKVYASNVSDDATFFQNNIGNVLGSTISDASTATNLWNWLKRNGTYTPFRSDKVTQKNADGTTKTNADGTPSVITNNYAPKMGDVLDTPLVAGGPIINGMQKYLVTAANDGMVYLLESQPNAKNPYKLVANYIPADMQRNSSTDLMSHYFSNIAADNYISTNNKHQYMINGGLVVRTTAEDETKKAQNSDYQQVFMAGNMGQGGRGVYALNVGGRAYNKITQKVGISDAESNFKQSVPLFEKTDLSGYTIGAPQIGRVAVDTTLADDKRLNKVEYAVFVSSGLTDKNKDSNNGTTALHIYHALSDTNVGLGTEETTNKAGNLIKTIPVPDANDKSGLMQPTLVDTDFNGTIDIAYAISYKGILYRFDLRDRDPKNWEAYKLFDAGKRVTSAPAVMRIEQADLLDAHGNKLKGNDGKVKKDIAYSVIFGTGSDLFESDLTSADDNVAQTVYGIRDDLDENGTQKSSRVIPDEISKSVLLRQEFIKNQKTNSINSSYDYKYTDENNTEVSSQVEGRMLSSNNYLTTNEKDKKGWYFDLPAQEACTTSGNTTTCTYGERVVTKPSMLLDTVILTTRKYIRKTTTVKGEPNPNQCSSTGDSVTTESSSEGWILQLRGDTGGAIPTKPSNVATMTEKEKSEISKEYTKYGYLDFLNLNGSKSNKLEDRPDTILSGYKQSGLISFTLLATTGRQLGLNSQSSYTVDGDAGGSGTDIPMNANGVSNTEDERCFTAKDDGAQYDNLGYISNSESGVGSRAYGVYGGECKKTEQGSSAIKVRRISWREIF